MKLIADCGATTSRWIFLDEDGTVSRVETPGINAMQRSADEIERIVSDVTASASSACDVREVHYFGAGCIDGLVCDAVASILRRVFAMATVVEVASDLVGTARALCGHSRGIACILGTGSNSCLYDGRDIVDNIPPLGYILGDEGSGAVMGRRLVAELYKRRLPAQVAERFVEEYSLDYAEVIRRVYREPGGGAYLASFVPFLSRNIDIPELRCIVTDCFTDFFERNVLPYPGSQSLPVNFTGSVAYHFASALNEVASCLGLTMGKIEREPIDSLIKYYQ